jgi:hypothetical protein
MKQRTRRLLLAAAGAAVMTGVLAIPATRASAQAFLDLFRVVNVAAVPVTADRINQLGRSGIDIPTLIGSNVEVLANPGPAQVFTTPADAGRAAAMDVRLPSLVPPNLMLVRSEMKGEHALRVHADNAKLREVLDALAIDDVALPAALDGKDATIRVPPIVRTVYANGANEVSLFQARSPEVALPAGVDLAAIGEIGLRIAGLGRRDAHTLAQAIDWRGTLLVPIPADASTFRQVDVSGARGLLLESNQPRGSRAVFWSANGVVYAMTGRTSSQTLLQMAQSVQ